MGAVAAVSLRLCEALERAAWGDDLVDAFIRFAETFGRGGASYRVEGGGLVVDAGAAVVRFEEREGETVVSATLRLDLGDPEQLLRVVAGLAGEIERLEKRIDALAAQVRALERRLEEREGE